MSIRVVITDDHPVVRDGLRYSIERCSHAIEVVAEAADGAALLALAPEARADVYIMDVTMPVLNCIEATRELRKRDPSARVIMLSLNSSDGVVGEALRAGAKGFLTKETATRHVVDAILEVHQGRCYLSPDIASYLVRAFLGSCAVDDLRGAPSTQLTPRETRVLQLIAEGHTGKEIAALLDISPNTVHKHRTHLMDKLDIHDQVGLARYAIREGIAKP